MIKKKQYELFEYAWLMMRQNPGGKSAYLTGYLLGFAGITNILPAIDPTTKEGEIKLKVGNGEVQVISDIDFTDEDPAELTPTRAAFVLNAAGFTGVTFSVDSETSRLKCAPTSPDVKLVQIYGDLAAALNFGGCGNGEGKGCYLWASLDGDLKSAAETEEWAEDTVIENDSPLGDPVKYTQPGSRSGTQVVLTDRIDSREARQMINGGTWIPGDADNPEVYEPPVSSAGESRKVDVLTFSKIFDKNANTPGDESKIRERMYVGGVGRAARSGGDASFTDSEYTLTFGTYTDDGKEKGSPRESDYTISQWEALSLDDLIVHDWAEA